MSNLFRVLVLAASLMVTLEGARASDVETSSADLEARFELAARSYPAGQVDLIRAQESRRGVNFIEVSDAEVTDILPNDERGSRHQKWVVTLANGGTVECVYNIDVTEPVPLKIGDRVSMGGQYIYENGGGLIHWLHEDRRGRRPNGYVEVNGVRYGAMSESGIYKN